MDIAPIIKLLRAEGSDTDNVEAKLATSGVPDRLAPILSAFANRPGGGMVIFGLDESDDFSAHDVFDVKRLKQAVINTARQSLEPPVVVGVVSVEFEGAQLVVATVDEAPASHKPVVVASNERAYLRQYDGTFPLSEQEVQAFIANRGQPQFDIAPTTATIDDLDPDSVAQFIREQRALSPVFGRWSDDELLRHARVLTPDGVDTVAGLLVFGLYPQSLLPGSGVQASCWTGPAKRATSRLVDSRALVGSIPLLLEQTVAWVARNSSVAIETRGDGHLYDRPNLPPVAVRELVANALVHRDLSPYSANAPISVTLEPTQLIISNPGSLFGLSVAALGRTDSHLRNPHLAQLLLTVRTPDGQRVIERLGSGIPRAQSALEEARMSPPLFHDTGLRFTARILLGGAGRGAPVARERQIRHRHTSQELSRPGGREAPTIGRHDEAILLVLRERGRTVVDISAMTGLSPRQVRYALVGLQNAGKVVVQAAREGRQLVYAASGPTA